MKIPVELSVANSPRRKAIVFSHERSGTHFLMNTLAVNFGYVSYPWWNLDYETGVNFHAPMSIFHHLDQVCNKPVLNIVKSHHPLPFVESILPYLAKEFAIFYIYRDPRHVMYSYWQWLQNVQWDEGPKVQSLSAFIHTAPRGAMLRYQKEQHTNMLQRWASHVDPWRTFAAGQGREIVLALRYEDLDSDFDATVRQTASFLELPITRINRPDRQMPGVGRASYPSPDGSYTPDDWQFFSTEIGESMLGSGYTITATPAT